MADFLGAIDQGTTSTRFMIFDHSGQVVASDQREFWQILPRAGWVEHDPNEIWETVAAVISTALDRAGLVGTDLAAVGLTNQRETAVVWDRRTGEPVSNAIVWQDTRTDTLCRELAGGIGPNRYAERVGLPLATYFSGPKVRWILDHVDGARARAERGELAFGTVDSWLIHRLLGEHLTDATNASRTMLMDLDSLAWDPQIAADMAIPASLLPEIRSSAGQFGTIREPAALAGVRLAGVLGDQQAAMVGQACLQPGTVKNTYGTGNFMLMNTGSERRASQHGLLTTVCYRFGAEPPVYALEGSIAVSGSLVHWVRDNLGLIRDAAEIEQLAASVPDNGGAYLVPAFSGLFAPRWRDDARGVLVGLTRYVNKAHIARAALEATAFQSRETPGCDERRRRPRADRDEGRRRHDQQRTADAVPGRHSRYSRHSAGGRRNHRAGRGCCRRPGHPASTPRPRRSPATGGRATAGSRGWASTNANPVTRRGTRRSNGASTGPEPTSGRLRVQG